LSATFAEAVEAATAERQQKRPRQQIPPKYLDVASTVILDRLEEVEQLSDSLYRPLDVEPLHDMRIAAKRLRYAIELFQECWGKDILIFAEEVAALQLSLGELHDCDVWIDSFGKHTIASKKKHQQDQSDAFAWLLNHFIEARNDYLMNALAGWRKWEAEGLSTKLRDIITGEEPISEPIDELAQQEPPSQSSTVVTKSTAT